jgi:thiol-disulfide isomerase/thioredoxin
MKYLYFLVLVFFILLTSCKKKEQDYTIVTLNYNVLWNGDTVILETFPLLQGTPKIITKVIKPGKDSIKFILPLKDGAMYKIRVVNKPHNVIFINDERNIRIKTNFFTGKYTVTGSHATNNLRSFDKKQAKLALQTRLLYDTIKALQQKNRKTTALNTSLNSLLKQYYQNYALFADTVSDPASFIFVYKYIDYGKDYNGLKSFIDKASLKFRGYDQINVLRQQVYNYIDIFQHEFNVGDKLPSISLKDTSGKVFSTSKLNGKYYLINFWASNCNACIPYQIVNKKIKQKFAIKGIELVSVALDEDVAEWKKTILNNNLPGVQLIDPAGWQGASVKTFKFDSIPYNFLVRYDGKVVSKNLKPGEIFKTIATLRL